MSADSLMMARGERESLAELLSGLTPQQWRAPSLCADWSVREVAVHVVSYDGLSLAQLAGEFVRGRLQVDAINDRVLRRHDRLSEQQVVELVRRSVVPRGLTAALGGMIALTDGTIHHQDIRRALALPRSIDERQLRAVLDFALRAPTLPARRHARGLALVADDIDWTHGSGAEIGGSAEALLMAVAGRPAALADLRGPGLDRLAERLQR